jgi:glycerol-3-phosphate dehydrogenase subunit B
MDLSADIVVIGGGLAGFTAALEAHIRGRKVIVIQKGAGVTHLSSGAIDLADSPLRTPHDAYEEHRSIERGIDEIIRREPDHPYTLLSRRLGNAGFLDFLRRGVRQVMAVLPLGWVGNLETNQLQITNFGILKPTALVQGSMAEGDILSMNQAKILVVGIRGFVPFNSRFIKDSLFEIQASQPVPRLQFVGHLEIDVHGLEGKSSLSALEIAVRLDREETFVRFGQSLLAYIQGKVYTHLILPPVMGIINQEPILLALRKITGLQVAETLATPMSIPGYRLAQAIRHFLETKQIDLIEGQVVGYDGEHRLVKSIRVHAGARRLKIKAKSFVLATGKYIGGGITRHQEFREPIFNFPVYAGQHSVTNQSVFQLTHSSISRSQPLFRSGLKTNELLQPFDQNGNPLFENLFAAGSILGGYDCIHDGTREGVAIATGSYAGQMAGSLV